MTYRQWQEKYLRELGGHYPEDEIRSVFELVLDLGLGVGRTAFHLNGMNSCSEQEDEQLENYLQRLIQKEPVQYVLGKCHFYGWEVEVGPGVLIPRQETEELVAWIVEDWRGEGMLRIADFGTGSGCIAISLAKSLGGSEVWGIDISGQALEIARRNAGLQGVELRGVEADMLAMGAADWPDSVDIMVSNPPYVRREEAGRMAAHVLDFEPHEALFVEAADPLIFYEAVLRLAGSRLAQNGAIYFEINEAFGQEMIALCHKHGFLSTELRKDLNGKDRMIKASKHRALITPEGAPVA